MDVRYEKGHQFATFKTIGHDNVYYAWGVVGFGESDSAYQTEQEALTAMDNLYNAGYRLTTEAPISEGNNADAGILLDWMGGITR